MPLLSWGLESMDVASSPLESFFGASSAMTLSLPMFSSCESLNSKFPTSPSLEHSSHSYPHLFMTLIVFPISLTTGCPCPQPSSSALAPFSSPKLNAFRRLFTPTTACAKLSREDKGCQGMVYLSKVTAKARTKGARFVIMTMVSSSASVAPASGIQKDLSKSTASLDFSSAGIFFLRLILDSLGRAESSEERFFDTRFAAVNNCFASFSSPRAL